MCSFTSVPKTLTTYTHVRHEACVANLRMRGYAVRAAMSPHRLRPTWQAADKEEEAV